MNIVVITGASSGIGREFALQMDRGFQKIDEFWLIARSRTKMERLAEKLTHKTRIFALDITKELDLLNQELKRRKGIVRILVNCAGYGIMGHFSEQEESLTCGMIRLNCEALTRMTHLLLPYMRRNSRIIQMASSAAFLPQPDFAVYAATKAYVLSFSRALGKELDDAGIYVTSVCPGPVDTPFFDLAEATGSTLSIKKYTMVTAGRVVKLALQDSCRRRPLSVCGIPIKAFRVLSKVIPHEILLEITDRLKKKGL